MCKHLVSLVYSKRAGSPVRKAILGYMADRASEDGDGIWTSKGRIARETEFSESAVKKAIRDMLDEGVIRAVGTRKHQNGWTVEYAIDKAAIDALPDARTPASGDPVTTEPRHQVTPTPASGDPLPRHQVTPNHPYNHPRTTKEDHRVSFDAFWEVWPNKVAKAAAEKAWKKLSAPDRAQATEAVPVWFSAWRRQNPQASPIHPASYLNQRRWEDQMGEAQADPGKVSRIERYRRMAR